METQEVIFYFDDSGVLHPSSKDRYFVYAGYVFLSEAARKKAKYKYLRAIRSRFPRIRYELKACRLNLSQKRYLNAVLQGSESLSCLIDKEHVYANILRDSLSIRRYKDYCVKRAIKEKLKQLIRRGKINPNSPLKIRIFIDNQPKTTNGFYRLKESVERELNSGMNNLPPLFHATVTVVLEYCDSRQHPLIQASDLLANSLHAYYNFDKPPTFDPTLHTIIFFP